MQTTAESLVASLQKALADSEEMRIFLKNYFMPGPQKKNFLSVNIDPSTFDTGISYESFFYKDKIRRLSIARLLDFLKKYVYYTHDFPSFYEDVYNRMILSLTSTTFVLDKRAPSEEIPTVAFNHDILFPHCKRLWQHYQAIKNDVRQSDIKKAVTLYQAYDAVFIMEGDLLSADQRKEYQSIRSGVVDSLQHYQDSLTPEAVARFLILKDSSMQKCGWSEEVETDIEKLRDPSCCLEDETAIQDNESDYSAKECRRIVGDIKRRKGNRAYYHLLANLYMHARPNSTEKVFIEKLIQGRILMDKLKHYDSPTSFIAKESSLISREILPLQALKKVEEEVQAEVAAHSFPKQGYSVGWLDQKNGISEKTEGVYKEFERGQPLIHFETASLPQIICTPLQSSVNPPQVKSTPPTQMALKDYRFIKQFLWWIVGTLGIGALLYKVKNWRDARKLKQSDYDEETDVEKASSYPSSSL